MGIGLAAWIRSSFGAPSIDQIVYHVRFGTGLISESGGAYVVTFLVECVAVPVILALVLVMVEGLLLKRASSGWTKSGAGRLVRWVARGLPLLTLLLSMQGLSAQVAVPEYVRALFGKDFFSAHYVDPSTVQLKPRHLKNLVLLYVEGLENSYGDSALFGKDLLHGLHALPGATFSNYQPAPGSSWTMGGLVATQCAIPLRTMSVLGSARAGEQSASFLPNAVCLGDVLATMGYRNVFLGGARLAFAGKGQFLADHGYSERYGKK
jgi:phosphoglycerol transferase